MAEDGTNEDVKTFTQEQVNDIVSDRVKKVNEKYADYDDLKKQVGNLGDQVNALTADLNKQKDDYEAKIHGYEINSVKMKTAMDLGLPADLANRLQGETEDEIRADAEKLASYTKAQTSPAYEPEPELSATTQKRETDPKRASLAKMLDDMKK